MTGRNTWTWKELRDQVYSVALKLTGNRADADDVTQEACLRIHLYLNSFRGESHFFTWVYSIVRNSFLDMCKQKNKHQDLLIKITAQVSPDFSDVILDRTLLSNLPSVQKQILVLRELYGYSYHEIARITRTSIDSVKSRLYRARKILAGLVLEQ